jgi:hypothetical protein
MNRDAREDDLMRASGVWDDYVTEEDVVEASDDGLGPSRGILLAVALSCFVWALVILPLWWGGWKMDGVLVTVVWCLWQRFKRYKN